MLRVIMFPLLLIHLALTSSLVNLIKQQPTIKAKRVVPQPTLGIYIERVNKNKYGG